MDKLKELLDKTFGKKISKYLYKPDLKSPKETFGYYPGEILTYEQLISIDDNVLVHLKYEEDGEACFDDFATVSKDYDAEWSIGGWPIPMDDLEAGQLIENCDNGDHTYTIREAVFDGKTDYDRIRQEKAIATYIIEQIQELIADNHKTTDKEKKKQYKNRLKELNSVLIKVMKF